MRWTSAALIFVVTIAPAAAAEKAAELVDPLSDHNASADYRRHLTAVLTRRAVAAAARALA